MAYNGEGRGGLLSAGGILSIIVGALEVIGGGLVAFMTLGIAPWHPIPPFLPGIEAIFDIGSTGVLIVGIVLAVLGIVAIVGGASALKRKNFGLSLAGAICALLPVNILGILAVIFVSLGKREFEMEEE